MLNAAAYSQKNSSHHACRILRQNADLQAEKFTEGSQRYPDDPETEKRLCAAVRQTDAEGQHADVLSWTPGDIKAAQKEDGK